MTALSCILRGGGMTNQNKPRGLPHHHLVAWHVAVEFLAAVRAANIKDGDLRNQAMRAAKSVCLNTAEGAGRRSRADKARVFAIARGEAVEAIAAIEIAGYAGDTTGEAVQACVALGARLVALLSGLMRQPARGSWGLLGHGLRVALASRGGCRHPCPFPVRSFPVPDPSRAPARASYPCPIF